MRVTDKKKLKSYYKYKPPLRFIRNKFFAAELKNLYEDNVQILCLQYALQFLWVAEGQVKSSYLIPFCIILFADGTHS